MNEIEQFFKILIGFLTIIGIVIGFFKKVFPNLFYENIIKKKNDYYLKMNKENDFKEEIKAVSDDLNYANRCKYYGNKNPVKHQIIPLLKYYNVENTIEKSEILSRYLTINNKLKALTLDTKNIVGQILFSLFISVICFFCVVYYSIEKMNSPSEDFFYPIIIIVFFFGSLCFFFLFVNTLVGIWKTYCIAKKRHYTMRKIYLKITKINSKKIAVN